MNKNESFIDQIITNMSEKSNRNGTIAKRIEAADHETVANRIAIVWDDLGRERRVAKTESVRNGQPMRELTEKPEHMLSLIQQTMNNCCWSARTVINAGKSQDLANGLDFSQSIAEQAGNIASSRIVDVESTLMNDFSVLNELHSWLCSQMNYMADLDPLFLYAEKEEIEEGVWEHTHMCMDINDVLPILDEKIIELAEQGDTNITKFASTHVFGARQDAQQGAKQEAMPKEAGNRQDAKPSKKAARKVA
jgi:hypothetical protein